MGCTHRLYFVVRGCLVLTMSEPIALADLFPANPAKAARLRRLGLHTSEDLLRSDRSRLSTATRGAVTVLDILQAQEIASLMEVSAMTLPWARALAAGGVRGAQGLALRALDQVTPLLAGAAPNDVARLLQDSVLLSNSGVLNGTVINAKGKPLGGVRVQSGRDERRTDRRGRFRLVRQPLWHGVTVKLAKAGYAPLQQTVTRLAPPEVVQGTRFMMKKGRAQAAARRALSQFKGEVLPPYDGSVVRVHVRKVARIPAGEVVRFLGMTATHKARLSSRFMGFDAGIFRVTEYRAPQTVLPAGAATSADFVATSHGLKAIALDAPRMAALRALRRVQVQGRAKAQVRTVEQALRVAHKRFDALRAEGVIGKKKQGLRHGRRRRG